MKAKEENCIKKMSWVKRLWKYFSTYEKIWFFSLTAIGITLAFVIPDEDTKGRTLLLVCSLLSLVSGMLCELLISKQNKWNFIVSVVFVEVTELVILFVLKYYASAIVTLVFWIPIDIWSFVDWNKHKDEKIDIVTKVRKLSWKQDLLVVLAMGVFGTGVGFLLKYVGGEDTFLDAFCAAVGMANGVFILLRFREQWIAWYIYTILEGVLWILSGQWVMLVLTVGYLTNTTYGYIKWTKYIKSHNIVCTDNENVVESRVNLGEEDDTIQSKRH